jgi:hypothetical protein
MIGPDVSNRMPVSKLSTVGTYYQSHVYTYAPPLPLPNPHISSLPSPGIPVHDEPGQGRPRKHDIDAGHGSTY